MEIVSYVLEGELSHKDNIGNGSVIRPGDVQRMSAGTGVLHSEFNPSPSNGVHFLQIWIMPDRNGYPPSYEQKSFSADERAGKLRLVASRDGSGGSVTIHQDAKLFVGSFAEGESTRYELAAGRHAWVHVARGSMKVQGTTLEAGDAAAIDDPTTIDVAGVTGGEVLLFDLA
jgi:redox-sensitive bicupin YhaK (pirin superfamily)